MRALLLRRATILPGFGLSLGCSLAYLSLIVLLPLAGLFVSASSLSPQAWWDTLMTDRVQHAFALSFGLSFAAAIVNVCIGLVVAWVLTRYRFPGRRWLDALVDVPFALPTAVAGIALTALYAPTGMLGRFLADMGVEVAFTPFGIFIALLFVGLPFVVRTVEPVMQDISREVEEASASLGATRLQTFIWVLIPSLAPALLAGFSMAFARGIGEYGSVIFIAGNMPGVSEIVPLLIVIKLEQYEIAEATAIAAVMLLCSFALLLLIHWLQAVAGIGRVLK